MVGLAGGAADRPARLWRDVGEVVVAAGCSAFRQIEAEAEVIQQLQLEPDDQPAGNQRIVEVVEDRDQSVVKLGMESRSGSRRSRAASVWMP